MRLESVSTLLLSLFALKIWCLFIPAKSILASVPTWCQNPTHKRGSDNDDQELPENDIKTGVLDARSLSIDGKLLDQIV